jgi:hypothetical protein
LELLQQQQQHLAQPLKQLQEHQELSHACQQQLGFVMQQEKVTSKPRMTKAITMDTTWTSCEMSLRKGT